jgi:hypothetical protein
MCRMRAILKRTTDVAPKDAKMVPFASFKGDNSFFGKTGDEGMVYGAHGFCLEFTVQFALRIASFGRRAESEQREKISLKRLHYVKSSSMAWMP